MDVQECFQQCLSIVKRQHVGSVRLCHSGVRMRFHKYTITTHGDSSTADGLNHFRVATRHARRLVGTLERMGDIHHYWHVILPHNGDTAKVNHQVLVSECSATFSEHDIVVAEMTHLVNGMGHRFRRQELSFLDIDATMGFSGSLKQRCLSAQKGWNLKHVDKRCCHRCVSLAMDVGDDRHTITVADGT